MSDYSTLRVPRAYFNKLHEVKRLWSVRLGRDVNVEEVTQAMLDDGFNANGYSVEENQEAAQDD